MDKEFRSGFEKIADIGDDLDKLKGLVGKGVGKLKGTVNKGIAKLTHTPIERRLDIGTRRIKPRLSSVGRRWTDHWHNI